ncbi:MAG TPA: sigma 54-interacting transcriptional regulator [Rhodocyclaceae bacterium]|nr:sigma 54-interacting transcriptional regulator [Rhodocyclaceae bacterium]
MGLTSDGRETKAQRFLASRREFFERGDSPEDGVTSLIMRSWQRCRERGLNHSTVGEGDLAGRVRLSESRERNAMLLEQASSVMEHVFEQIRSSGSLVVLSDPDGCIIHSLGDPDFVDRANRVALQPGACWNEVLRGTNAIGTAIAEKRPVEVLGLEHYLEGNGFLSCSAVPVMAADGTLCGVLDISSDHRVHQRHTLGLVKLSVQLLEKRLFESAYSGGILIAFHERPEYLGSLQEGVIALSADGELLGANTVARDWLTARVRDGDAIGFNSIFAQGFRRIIDKASSASNTMLKLAMRRGGDLYVQVRSMRPLMVPAVRDAGEYRQGGDTARGSPDPVGSRRTEATSTRISLDSLATGDPALGRALDRARRVQGKDIPLLIQGESGVGKELFAQAFHNSGPRASGPFVALNCAAVPESLIRTSEINPMGQAR